MIDRMDFSNLPRPALLCTLVLGAPAAAAADRYTIDPIHTRVAFRVMHAGLSPSIGTLSQPTGSILFDAAHPEASQVTIHIDLATLDMGDAHWNRKVRDDFLNSQKFPDARFRSTAVQVISAQLWQVSGALEIAGGSTPVTFITVLNAHKRHPLTLKKTLGLQASTAFSRKALGIDAWSSLVGDRVHLDVTVEATLADKDAQEQPP